MSAKQRAAISAGLKRHYASKGDTAKRQRGEVVSKKFKGIKLKGRVAKLVAKKAAAKRARKRS